MRKALLSTIFATAALLIAFSRSPEPAASYAATTGKAVLGSLAWEAWGKVIEFEAGSGRIAPERPGWGDLAGVSSRIVLGAAFDRGRGTSPREQSNCQIVSMFGSIVRYTLGGTQTIPRT